MEQFNKSEIERMRNRVQAIRGFYTHFIIYLLVNVVLVIINLLSTPDVYWFYWTTLGWGIGVASHWWGVFGSRIFFSRDWEEKKIRELLEKERQKGQEH